MNRVSRSRRERPASKRKSTEHITQKYQHLITPVSSKPKINVWFQLRSIYKNDDWIHQSSIHREKPIVSNKNDDIYTNVYPFTINESDKFYILYHFHDNYCDNVLIFTNKTLAKLVFNKKHKEQLVTTERMSMEDPSSHYICSVQDNGIILSSTIYEKVGNRMIYPDKGSRWVLLVRKLKD